VNKLYATTTFSIHSLTQEKAFAHKVIKESEKNWKLKKCERKKFFLSE
jgi:hypothetical protein